MISSSMSSSAGSFLRSVVPGLDDLNGLFDVFGAYLTSSAAPEFLGFDASKLSSGLDLEGDPAAD